MENIIRKGGTYEYENPKSRGGQIMNGSVLLQLFPIFQSIDHGYCTYSNLVVYIY